MVSETAAGRDFWTTERIARLTQLWNEGLPAPAIGRAIGCTKNSVLGKAHRIGLKPRKSPIRARKIAPVAKPKPKPTPKLVLVRPPTLYCQWPIGDPGEKEFHFCGALPVAGKPYCGPHAHKAYQRAPLKRLSP